ncbi:MAG: hypothetical protein V2A77_09460 [Pseudomonadota bacterium]
MSRLTLSLALVVALGGLTGGCSRPNQGPTNPQPRAAHQAPKRVSGATAGPQFAYLYNPLGKPDPFRPFGNGTIGNKKDAPAETSGSTTLRDLEVGQLLLVGIAQSPGRTVALVEDSTGRGYTLVPGMSVGPHGAVVKEIGPDGVKVLQKTTDYAGRLRTETTVLKMVREEE